jgi:hypothetical protein
VTSTHRYTSSTYDLEVDLDGAVFCVELSNQTEYWGGRLACSNTEGQAHWVRWDTDNPLHWFCDAMWEEDLLAVLIQDGAIVDEGTFLALPVDTIKTLEEWLGESVVERALDR